MNSIKPINKQTMKKIISFAACATALFMASCGSGDYLEKKELLTKGDSSTLDTLSYVIGMNIGNQIVNGVMPQLKADYNALVGTIEKAALTPDKTIEVAGVKICKDSMNVLGMKYLGPEFNGKVMAALRDSTGNTQIFADDNEKLLVSTLIGANIGYSLTTANMPIQTTWILNAINDVNDKAQKIDDNAAEAFMRNYHLVTLPEAAKKEAADWLATIEKKSGVQKTESGILYIIEDEGDINAKATSDDDKVKVLYTGRNCYGEVFDSNRWSDMPKERQEMMKQYRPDEAGKDNPIEFPLSGVIKGWTEGMKLIGKGGKITLWIPSELAYGERGAGPQIGPHSALRFDVELLDVIPAAPVAPAAPAAEETPAAPAE